MRLIASSFPLQELGAGCFGAVIGRFTCSVNRYRSGEVKLKDVGTLGGIVGPGERGAEDGQRPPMQLRGKPPIPA